VFKKRKWFSSVAFCGQYNSGCNIPIIQFLFILRRDSIFLSIINPSQKNKTKPLPTRIDGGKPSIRCQCG